MAFCTFKKTPWKSNPSQMSQLPQFPITNQSTTPWPLPPLLYFLRFPIISSSAYSKLLLLQHRTLSSIPLTLSTFTLAFSVTTLAWSATISVSLFSLIILSPLLYSILQQSILGFLISFIWVVSPTPSTSTFLDILRTLKYISNYYRKYTIYYLYNHRQDIIAAMWT